MIIDGCIARLKAGGLIEVEACPSFTIETKRKIVKFWRDKIENNQSYKVMPDLSMTVEPL